MNKKDIKNILISMKTTENESFVNTLLGKIDIMDETSLQNAINQVGNSEEDIRNFFERKLSEKQTNSHQEHFPINDMFTYGIAENCIHLHLPGDLYQMLEEKGFSGTMDTVNLSLLDAIDKIRELKNNGFYKFQGKDSIYMISPILIGKELKFLENIDFKTHLYRKKDLADCKFVQEHPEAKLATHIFGKDKNIGTALISLDTISTKQWQDKKKQKVEEFNKKGITLDISSHSRE